MQRTKTQKVPKKSLGARKKQFLTIFKWSIASPTLQVSSYAPSAIPAQPKFTELTLKSLIELL